MTCLVAWYVSWESLSALTCKDVACKETDRKSSHTSTSDSIDSPKLTVRDPTARNHKPDLHLEYKRHRVISRFTLPILRGLIANVFYSILRWNLGNHNTFRCWPTWTPSPAFSLAFWLSCGECCCFDLSGGITQSTAHSNKWSSRLFAHSSNPPQPTSPLGTVWWNASSLRSCYL